jgi:hypothetical protein
VLRLGFELKVEEERAYVAVFINEREKKSNENNEKRMQRVK